MGFEFDELLELADALDEIAKDYPDEVGRVQEEVAERFFERTQLVVPKETTALAESGRLDKSGNTGLERVHKVTYGDSNTDGVGVHYAAAVHEILDATHPNGQAKYVEGPMLEAIPELDLAMKKASDSFVDRKLP